MTNEKDREEVDKIIDLWYKKDTSTQLERKKAIVDEIARIRAEAMQAERERDIAGEVWDLLLEHLPAKGRTELYDKMREKFPVPAILSDDQEAEIIEMPGEAPPVVAFKRFERRTGRTTDIDDQEARNG